MLLTGCATTNDAVIIHPVTNEDIIKVPAGAEIAIPAGTVIKNENGEIITQWDTDTKIKVKKNGRFLSEFYILEIMKAKTDDVNVNK